MADGVTGETGENATLPVEMESKSACVPVPILLRLMARLGAPGSIKKQGHVTMDHAKVGN